MDSNVHNVGRKTCRTCVRVHESKNDLISIFAEDQTSRKMKFSAMLSAVANHPVHENDSLPQRICMSCACSIRSAYFFKVQAENSYRQLHAQLTRPLETGSITVKQEKADNVPMEGVEQSRSDVPLILEPRTLDSDAAFSEELLIELETPCMQEPISYNNDEDHADSDAEGLIVYEPSDFTDHDQDEPESMPEDTTEQTLPRTTNDKSPDSGLPSSPMPCTSKDKSESPSNLVCNVCHKHMFSEKAMLRHKRNFHSLNKCSFCKKRFGSKMHLKQHVKIRHPARFNEFRLNGQVKAVVRVEPFTEIPKCEGCDLCFCSKQALMKHRADCDLKCSECGLILHYKESYLQHLNKEHKIVIDMNPLLECPFGCTTKFKTDKILQEHIERTHPDPVDDESWVSDGEDSTQSGPFTVHSCQTCDAVFKSHNALTQHNCKNKKKPAAPEKLKTRNVPQYTRDEFVEKFMVHKTQETSRCLACNFDVGRRSVYCHLKNKHASVKTYRCELCPEAFFRSDYRSRHMAAAHPNQYKCGKCNVQFDRIYKYDAHMEIHGVRAKNFKPADGQDKFDLGSETMKYIEDMSTFDYSSCPIQRRLSIAAPPAKSASVETPMTKEEFTKKYFKHLPDGRWYCSICSQDMQYSSIHSHVLWRHATMKPFKCAFCNERSVKHLARMSHMNRCHPNEYRCNICTHQSARHAAYAAHMFREHRVTVTSQPSVGEEPDITTDNLRFLPQKPENEVIPESEDVIIEQVFTKSSRKKPDPASVQVYKEDNSREMTFEEFRANFLEDNGLDYKCLICDRTLRKRNIGLHVKGRHATTGAFKCAVCPEAFFRTEHRIQHMAEKHRGMFHCQWCNIQFYRNSRFAAHLKQQHDIEVDDTDQYEVDLNLNEVKYVAKIVRGQGEDSQPSIVHEPEPEEEPEAYPEETPAFEQKEGLNRSMFISKYFPAFGKENRKCEPCNKIVPNGSVHHHLMHEHALVYPYKCPFCDLRLYFASLRVRHMQVFHPNDYKCDECALQFQNHSKFSEHMLVEHGRTDIQGKSPLEVPDIATNAIRYAVYRNGEDDGMLDESSSSTGVPSNVPKSNRASTSKAMDVFLKPKIKEEPREEVIMHSIFGTDEPEAYDQEPDTADQDGLSYNDFIAHHTAEQENGQIFCRPCNKSFLKTSISQHMRNKHTTSNGYKCELCPAGFLIGELRRKHMMEVHPNDYLCSKCPIQFYYSITYKKHMKEVHKTNVNVHIQKLADEVDIPLDRLRFAEFPQRASKTFQKPASTKTSTNGHAANSANQNNVVSYQEFVADYIVEKDDKSFRCLPCGKTIPKTFYTVHLVRYHSVGKHYGCQLCDEKFKKKPTRLRHMLNKHENDFKCYDCVVQYDTASAFKEHMRNIHDKIVAVRVAKPESEMDVPIEQMRYSAVVAVDDANPTFNIPKNTYDDIPDDILLTRDQLYGKFYRSIKKSAHESGIAKTKCLACNKIFSSQNRALHAFYNHAVSRPFKCELCAHKGFYTKIKRMMHMKLAHPKDYACLRCNKQFDRAHDYAMHMKEHQVTVIIPNFDDDVYNVPVEKMGYMKSRSMAKVMLKEKCRKPKAESSPAIASRDQQVEPAAEVSDVQQYFNSVASKSSKCDVCNKEFATSRALRIHLRNHTDGDFIQVIDDDSQSTIPEAAPTPPPPVVIIEKNEACDICGNKFATPFALNAHKKMKHEAVWKKRRNSVYTPSGKFFEFFCDICEFTSPRRDYLDRHVAAAHNPEFRCHFCNKQMSNYNYYLFHLYDYHPTVAANALLKSAKCDDCYKCFQIEQNRDSHMMTMHKAGRVFPKHYCPVCCVALGDKNGLECHKILKSHKQHVKFLAEKAPLAELITGASEAEPQPDEKPPEPEVPPEVVVDPPKAKLPALKPIERQTRIKPEPTEASAVTVTRTRSKAAVASPEPGGTDPMLAMMSKTVKAEPSDEPQRKRTRLASSNMASTSSRSSLEEPAAGEDDKMEYLKYLKTVGNSFECGLCGKRKNVRKYMLHHLKQHKEIPTYQCSQCQEKFVFKRKYELHLETHKVEVQREVIDVDDHPKFQVAEPQVNKIECKICQQVFRLTIILNRHNTQWHAESNPDRELSANDQKLKKEGLKAEPTVIKVIKCKFCSEAFIKASDLETHMAEKHTPVQDEADEDDEEATPGNTSELTCDKCNFTFNEQKYLENHQQFFCQYREVKNGLNEQ